MKRRQQHEATDRQEEVVLSHKQTRQQQIVLD